MKLAIVLLSLAAFVAAEEPLASTYGYLRRFGVPLADRIRASEEEYFKNPLSRIFNGSPARLGQFPYQAGLVIALNPSGTAVCGAVLVRANRLLTAAHCWTDGQTQARSFTVVLGSITLFSGGTRIQTSNIVVHPSWNPRNARNDIAVIRLSASVRLSNNINVVALPSGSQLNLQFAGETGVASGFGGRGNVAIASNQFLSFANLNIITNSACQLAFPGMIQSSNICTRGSASTCGGDSGGPLVVQRNGRPLLVGLTSFGLHPNFGGCEVGHAAVFARVTSFISFINQNL